MAEFKLSEQDHIDMLEEIARSAGNAAARIAAIKELRSMRGEAKPASGGFAALDGADPTAGGAERAGVRLKVV